MSLRNELVKLAKSNPAIRAHLLPILKQGALEKMWRLLGELVQSPDGTLTLKINLRSGGSAAAMWRKFYMAYMARKLVVTFDDTFLTIAIPKGHPSTLEDTLTV